MSRFVYVQDGVVRLPDAPAAECAGESQRARTKLLYTLQYVVASMHIEQNVLSRFKWWNCVRLAVRALRLPQNLCWYFYLVVLSSY